MSCMKCDLCEAIVDTDEDMDALEFMEDMCFCVWCRDEIKAEESNDEDSYSYSDLARDESTYWSNNGEA